MNEGTGQAEGISIHFDKILFATDFSPASATALPYVAAIVRRFNSQLWIVHIVSSREFEDTAEQQGVDPFTRVRQNAETPITALLNSTPFKDIPHHMLLERGEVMSTLSRLADEHAIDLIAAGTHGPHGLQKLVSGSTAEEIQRLARRPVLLVGPDVATDPQAEVNIERILFATDFRPESRFALEYAYALARAYAAHLIILHVVDNPLDEPLATRMSGEAFCRLRMLETKWPERRQSIEPEFVLEFGSRQQWTLDTIAKRDVQLLVLSAPRTAHPLLKSHLPGPLTYDIITHSRCPVITIRAEQSPT
ncbi:MAG TPA: universal stress protein [Candidatus Acidoferrum sp.]|nr:universal stress protein [Candidatus Acidoferrum sp.]